LKYPDPSDISPREYFQLILAAMHYSLYSNIFVEGSTPEIIPNPLYSHLANAEFDQVQVGAILPLEEEKNKNLAHLPSDWKTNVSEGRNHMTHLFHETHLVDSYPSCKPKESYLLNK